jgi:hypothetical protein
MLGTEHLGDARNGMRDRRRMRRNDRMSFSGQACAWSASGDATMAASAQQAAIAQFSFSSSSQCGADAKF